MRDARSVYTETLDHASVPNMTTPAVRRLPRSRITGLPRQAVTAIALSVVAITMLFWVAAGGLGLFGQGSTGIVQALGQLTGLAAALAAMGGLLVTARPAGLERRYGLDRMLAAHRWFGITAVFTVLAHTVFDTWAWAESSHTNWFSAFAALSTQQAWMMGAAVGTALFVIIGSTSYRRLRQALSYETWYFIHLLGYLAVILAFGHQLTLGSNFAGGTVARWWWIALALTTLALVVWSRIGVIVKSLTRPLSISAVVAESRGIGSIHVAGPGLQRMRVSGGQYFMIRPLARGLWWQAHPFSVSAAPTTRGIRFTIKASGDDSQALLRLCPGTRVLLEGPYGTFTTDRARGRRVVLVAGGVGIAPIRALLEDCNAGQQPVVIVRVSAEADLAHRAELEQLVESRNGTLHVLAGSRAFFSANDPFQPARLRAVIPDIAQRDVFICGPHAMESAVIAGVRKAGVATDRIHREEFSV